MAELSESRIAEINERIDQMIDDGKTDDEMIEWCDSEPDAKEITKYLASLVDGMSRKPIETGKKNG